MGLVTQGYFGKMSLVQSLFSSVVTLISEICFFIIIIRFNLDLTLKTQVLAAGSIVLIGYDEHGIEQVKFYIKRGGHEKGSDENDSDQVSNDCFTDNGCVTPSAISDMSYNDNGSSMFVDDYKGDSNAISKAPKPSFSINADARPVSPSFHPRSSLKSGNDD